MGRAANHCLGAASGEGRAEVRFVPAPSPLQEGLQEPNEVDVGEGESEEKEEDVKPTSNGKDCDCTVVGGLLTSSSCLGEQLM